MYAFASTAGGGAMTLAYRVEKTNEAVSDKQPVFMEIQPIKKSEKSS